MKIQLLNLLIALALISCDEGGNSENREFAPGEVLVGIKSTVPMNLVFEVMNEKGVLIKQMSGFYHYSNLPEDSLAFIQTTLESKSYTYKWGANSGLAFISDDKIIVTGFFSQMDLVAQTDWLATMNQLQMDDTGNEFKSLVISIPPGKETYWTKELSNHVFVSWAEPNYLNSIY